MISVLLDENAVGKSPAVYPMRVGTRPLTIVNVSGVHGIAGVLPCQHLLNALSYKRAEIRVGNGFVFRPNRTAVARLFQTAAIVARCGLASVTRLSHIVYWQHCIISGDSSA